MNCLVRSTVLLLLACALSAQTHETNPFTSVKDVAEGRRLYSFFCVFCHGMDGASGRGARLASIYRRHGTSDRDEFRVIAGGVPGTEMTGSFLEEDEIWKILAFVRTLEQSAAATGAACATSPGDANAGRQVFLGKGACLSCHSATIDGRVQGSGRLGPDLTGIGAARTRQHLRESLLDPSLSIAPAYRQVSVATKGGETYRGLVLNEDEYTLHLMTPGDQIRSFYKADLQTIDRLAESLMPAYGALRAEELEDLLSYLCTLRGNGK